MTTTSDIISDALIDYHNEGGSDAIDALADRLGINRESIMIAMSDADLTSSESIDRMTEEEFDSALQDCVDSVLLLIS